MDIRAKRVAKGMWCCRADTTFVGMIYKRRNRHYHIIHKSGINHTTTALWRSILWLRAICDGDDNTAIHLRYRNLLLQKKNANK